MKICSKCSHEQPDEAFYKEGCCKKCRRESNLRWMDKNREGFRKWQRDQHKKQPEIKMLSGAKQRAKKQGVPFTLSLGDIHVPLECPALGIPLVTNDGHLGPNSPSLDRIVPEVGYVPGNVVVISCKANVMKSNATLEEHELLVKWLKKFKKP